MPQHRHVRTTVDIPDAVYQRLKRYAAAEGRSIRELVLIGLERVLPPEAPIRHTAFPLLRSRNPEKRRVTGEDIYGGIEFP